MKCLKENCLLCKYSIIGDACDGTKSFERCSMKDILNKKTVYKVKIDFLSEQIERAKSKGKIGSDTKRNMKSLEQAIKIKSYLDEEFVKISQENINFSSMINFKRIEI